MLFLGWPKVMRILTYLRFRDYISIERSHNAYINIKFHRKVVSDVLFYILISLHGWKIQKLSKTLRKFKKRCAYYHEFHDRVPIPKEKLLIKIIYLGDRSILWSHHYYRQNLKLNRSIWFLNYSQRVFCFVLYKTINMFLD